jgi:hypothetical protein
MTAEGADTVVRDVSRLDSGIPAWRHTRKPRADQISRAGETLATSAPSSPIPAADRRLRCTRCGLTIHPATIRHEQTLVFASCCPRCDGELAEAGVSASPAHIRSEPSIYLG